MSKILLIEDEAHVISFIQKGLTEENFDVSIALNGNMGLEMAGTSIFDLIILDIMLPDKNGIDVCKNLRNNNIHTPVLFLTALNTADNIALGLNAGGDDYLVKPFKFIELIARINAILRRSNFNSLNDKYESKNKIYIADLIVDDDAKTVTRAGDLITLTATEYRLLISLLKNKGKVMSRMELLENVWDINFNLETNVVDVYINYLRKKIDNKFDTKIIQTVIGMGYVIKDK
jgi:two-component system copper resistance phosphate regulon response regulator CusR